MGCYLKPLFIFFSLVVSSYAMEADNFTGKGVEKLPDVSNRVNILTNRMIQKAIASAKIRIKPKVKKTSEHLTKNLINGIKVGDVDYNCSESKSKLLEQEFEQKRRIINGKYGLPPLPKKLTKFDEPQCDRKELNIFLMSYLDQNWPAIRDKMLADKGFEKGKVNTKRESIYNSTSGGGMLMKVGGCCDPLVNINGYHIGIDKIDHFFGHGAMYFKKFKKKFKKSTPLVYGIAREHGGWGLAGTGIKSYGDLAANYSGMFFWANLLDGDSPYIKCVNGEFKQVKEFDIRNYVNSAMDESINCSSFSSEKMAKQVDYFAQKLGKKKKCPVSLSECGKLKKFYSKSEAKAILHPRCRMQNRTSSTHEKNKQSLLQTLKDFKEGAFNDN